MSAAESVIQLANKLDPHFKHQELSDEERGLVCQALHHYAEILSAEPVAYIGAREAASLTKSMTHAYVMPAKVYENDVPLIRKPGEPT